MPREIFNEVVSPSVTVGTRKWYTVPLSVFTHVFVVGVLLAAPLLATMILPLPRSVVIFTAPPPPPSLRLPPPPHVTPDVAPVEVDRDAAPIEAPTTLSPEPAYEPRSLSLGVAPAVGVLAPDGAPSVGITAPPQPVTTTIRVGGAIEAPRLLKRIDPVYPAMARNARLQGYAVIEATIGRDGAVKDVRVVKSAHPLLDKAALDAVAQWKYSPTILNGEAVDVLLNVTVTFTLR